jgi:hypothetical protein
MNVTKKDLGIDPLTGIHTFEVSDADTGEVVGYDHVAPDSEE